ncbi:helix-turn-helix transcriptional regulator [Deinococcus sonorensis]|uniref:Helix-turn-helix transcriptional regulator n=2 Tax=Deinococcus sonorensis TaxID=309891 RepID=A0AAU7U785_9DEIO
MTMHHTPTPPLAGLIEARMRQLNCATAEEFAQEADVSRYAVEALLRGHDAMGIEYTPSLHALVNLSHALRTPAHELLYMLCPDALSATVWTADA